MRENDRDRWNIRWSGLTKETFSPHPLLTRFKHILKGGLAVDIACGIGQNAIWLAKRDHKVFAVDISGVALNVAVSHAAEQGIADRILFAQMDIKAWSVPRDLFDVICVFRFLDRNIYPGIHQGLKRNGLLFYATRHIGLLDHQPQANRNYLLQPGELLDEFGQWEVIFYEEGSESAQIIVRKP